MIQNFSHTLTPRGYGIYFIFFVRHRVMKVVSNIMAFGLRVDIRPLHVSGHDAIGLRKALLLKSHDGILHASLLRLFKGFSSMILECTKYERR